MFLSIIFSLMGFILFNLLIYLIVFIVKKIKQNHYKLFLKKELKKQNKIDKKEKQDNIRLLDNIMQHNSFKNICQLEEKTFISFDISLLKLKSNNYNKLQNDDYQSLLEFSKFLIENNKYPIFITKNNEGILVSKKTNLSLKITNIKNINIFVNSIKEKIKKQNNLK